MVLGVEGRDLGGGGEEEAAAKDEGRRGEDEALQKRSRMMREEVLASVARIGGRLGELRLDTDLDISHGVVRYLELLKLSALTQRPDGQHLEEALADINARLLAATTPLQREIFQTSALDELLTERSPEAGEDGDGPGAGSGPGTGDPTRDDENRARARAQAIAPREASSLGPFLPRKGIGLALSASDVETYRGCPLRYKYARVLRIPTEQTQNQRFGIVVHQVLERYHSTSGETLEQLLELLEQSWRRSGFGTSDERERELYGKARAALVRYHERLHGQDSEPVWFERPFSFRLGPHHLRGRVDRVDRLGGADGEEYELIDYKTSARRAPSSSRTTSSCRSTRSPRASPGAWRPPGRPTTTCSTISRSPCPATTATPRRSSRSCSPPARASSRSASSRRHRSRRARCATIGSSARRRSGRSDHLPLGAIFNQGVAGVPLRRKRLLSQMGRMGLLSRPGVMTGLKWRSP